MVPIRRQGLVPLAAIPKVIARSEQELSEPIALLGGLLDIVVRLGEEYRGLGEILWSPLALFETTGDVVVRERVALSCSLFELLVRSCLVLLRACTHSLDRLVGVYDTTIISLPPTNQPPHP